MSKTIEISDIAQWEETDSELVKYTIGKLSRELDVSIKVAKSLAQDLENATNRIDKAIEYIEDNMSYVVKGNKEYIPTGEDLLDILRGE